ncbi:MAG: type II toxin-antitoxin system VapC family toxin [Deltaproteobacteria bacterium]|nr:type II toxin-antitoxin system VapC family toxin [Deltaproteobacteria bacterium]
MYLIDTNVWLERLLDQQRAEEVGRFLDRTPPEYLLITDFALHSIGVILTRLKQPQALVKFVQDLFLEGAVGLVRLEPEDLVGLVGVMERFNLDFDDAYQYLAAEKHRLTLVSFDSDFDQTEMGRMAPEQAK